MKKSNLLSKPVEGQGVKVAGSTKEEDFTNVSTVKDVIRNIKGPGDIVLLFAVYWWFNVAAIEPRTTEEKRLE